MIEDKPKHLVRRLLRPLSKLMARHHVSPTLVTVVGAIGVVCAGVILQAPGHIGLAAVAFAIFLIPDVIDGEVARLRSMQSARGELFDSVADRAVEGAIYLSSAWWLLGE